VSNPFIIITTLSLENHFCAHCEDDAHCIEIVGPTNEVECRNTDVCFLPNGEIEFISEARV